MKKLQITLSQADKDKFVSLAQSLKMTHAQTLNHLVQSYKDEESEDRTFIPNQVIRRNRK